MPKKKPNFDPGGDFIDIRIKHNDTGVFSVTTSSKWLLMGEPDLLMSDGSKLSLEEYAHNSKQYSIINVCQS